jgi:hypothetical protein
MGVSLFIVFYDKLRRPTPLKLFLLTTIFLTYLLGVAYIFSVLNSPIDIKEQNELIDVKLRFLKYHDCIQYDGMQNFVAFVVNASDHGVIFVKNSTEFSENWTFGGETLFFTFTLLATIGY